MPGGQNNWLCQQIVLLKAMLETELNKHDVVQHLQKVKMMMPRLGVLMMMLIIPVMTAAGQRAPGRTSPN